MYIIHKLRLNFDLCNLFCDPFISELPLPPPPFAAPLEISPFLAALRVWQIVQKLPNFITFM